MTTAILPRISQERIMVSLSAVAAAYSIIAGLLLLAGYTNILRQFYASSKIQEVDAPAPSSFPSLSILVPARNEAESIERALQSLLEQDYPDMEVLVIDDRSTDGTGAIVDRLSEEYERLRTLHIEHLPDNWVGKTHALKRGYEETTGEWVLMTDADVEYDPGGLRRLVAVALHETLDQMSCLPEVRTNGFLHEVAFDGWVSAAVGAQNLQGVRDPDSDEYFALGAFNLVRRAVFDQTKGFSWLRMEIADDMGTAKMMRDEGARQGFFFAFEELSLEWYGSLGDMIAGLEKNGIAVLGHYSYLRGFLIPVGWLALLLGPLVGLVLPWAPVQAFSAGVVLLSVPFPLLAAWRLERPASAFLLWFAGVTCTMYALVRSTYACARRGGVLWRGTLYPVETLREQQRVKF